jgi:hypothetical protein
MREDRGKRPQKTRLFGHTELVGEPGIEFKQCLKTHLALVIAFALDFN